MKGRLFVVNENTPLQAVNERVASIFMPKLDEKPQREKTIADIMADMLQIEIGDYIFLGNKRFQ